MLYAKQAVVAQSRKRKDEIRCTQCMQWKKLEEFRKTDTRIDGYSRLCLECEARKRIALSDGCFEEMFVAEPTHRTRREPQPIEWPTDDYRICKDCGNPKPIREFIITGGKFRSYCKSCAAKRSLESRKRNDSKVFDEYIQCLHEED
jgi:hypothetical protein